MSTLAEAREVFNTLQQSDTLVDKLVAKSEVLTSNVSQLNMALNRSIGLARHVGLPQDIDRAIAKVQQLISTLYQMHYAISLTLSATGPLGLAVGVLGVLTALVAAAQYMDLERPRY